MINHPNLSKNRGEWAEVVSVFKCLLSGRVATVRSDGGKLGITGAAVVISKLLLERSGHRITYELQRSDGKLCALHIKLNGTECVQIPFDEVRQDTQCLVNGVISAASKHKSGNFSVDGASEILSKYHLGTGKTQSSLKQDVELCLIDPDGIELPSQGFSVKSFVGADPTLFNASRAARFKYRLDGSAVIRAKQIAKDIQADRPRSWVQVLFHQLDDIRAFTNAIEIPDPKFERNLELLDSRMPEVIGAMLLKAYTSGDMSVKNSLDRVVLSDPLGYGGDAKAFYTLRIKKFLRAAALGFSSSRPWNGYEGADGGMLLIDKDWNLYCMMSGRAGFEEYLLHVCRFESPSSSVNKHGGYGKVETEWHGTYVDLLLQIREGNPF